jgi:hypothetical protein
MLLEMRGNSAALKAHENARWAGMVASSWVQATVGVCYCFGLYSPMLKEFLGYNQAQINTLGFAKDLGTYVAVLQGLAVDVIPVWGFLALGSIQSLVGYGVLWLVLSGRIAPPPYWMVLSTSKENSCFKIIFLGEKKNQPSRLQVSLLLLLLLLQI